MPLLARDDVIGLLGVFPAVGTRPDRERVGALAALAAQLAVAVQNAQLHERAKRLGEERERALEAEKAASKQVRALYEISRSFAQSLSLEATLERRGQHDRGRARRRRRADSHAGRAPRVCCMPACDGGCRAATRRSRALDPVPAAAVRRASSPAAVQARRAVPGQPRRPWRRSAPPATALLPFLERGWTGAAVPIATPAEVLGLADDPVDAPRLAGDGGDDRTGGRDRRTGGARDRQRAPLPAAEGVRRHDAALAAAALVAGAAGTRARRRIRVVGARRGRRRRLRLHGARRTAGLRSRSAT